MGHSLMSILFFSYLVIKQNRQEILSIVQNLQK